MHRTILTTTLLTLLALPALAVTPQAGDIVSWNTHPGGPGEQRLELMDPITGSRTVISCWLHSAGGDCAEPVGSGPGVSATNDSHMVIGPDGAIYLSSAPQTPERIVRIDVSTGARSLIEPVDLGDELFRAFTVWPAPSFFPPTVAALGGWGLAVLVVGIVIGVQVRMRP